MLGRACEEGLDRIGCNARPRRCSGLRSGPPCAGGTERTPDAAADNREPGAGFHPLGEALAQAYRSAFPDLNLEVIESPGLVRNVEAIQKGEADLGFAFADVAYVAFVGRLAEHGPFARLRGMAVLQLNQLHVVVRAQSKIDGVAGLRGRRVGVGPPGSGTALTADLVLRAFGFIHNRCTPNSCRSTRRPRDSAMGDSSRCS